MWSLNLLLYSNFALSLSTTCCFSTYHLFWQKHILEV
uniref:Uncharacterized protein n=1 Tax=Anguilla anguilla TaxID=7936 RepID=A0A0E9QRT0_ANGAN